MKEELPKSRLPHFLQNRLGETAIFTSIGFAIGYGAGEVFEVYNGEVLHQPFDYPPAVTGTIGSIAVGAAIWHSRNRNKN